MNKQQLITKRLEYIQGLQQFLVSSKETLSNTLHQLNWTEEATILKANEKPLSICPLNAAHRVYSGNIDKHVETCRWHQRGYSDDSVPFPPPSKNVAGSIVIDKKLQADIILEAAVKDPSLQIAVLSIVWFWLHACANKEGANVRDRDVPQTSDRYYSDFTTDERRILYDYVVARTSGALPELNEFNLSAQPGTKSGPKTQVELMAAERDAKRRRIRYRTAKVHTKSKNYSQVLREVINNQMLAYEDMLKDHYGLAGSSTSVQSEKKDTEAKTDEKKDWIWLDWDFRSNPHIKWKYLLEKEKARVRRKEDGINDKRDRGCSQDRREKDSTRNRDEIDRKETGNDIDRGSDKNRERYDSGRKYYDRNEHDLHKRKRYEYDIQERPKRRNEYDSCREQDKSHRDRNDRRSGRSDRIEYEHLSHKEDRYKDYDKEKHRRETDEDRRHKRKHSDTPRREPYNKDLASAKVSTKQRRYESEYYQVRVKREHDDDSKSKNGRDVEYDNVVFKQEKFSGNESDDRSSQSSSSYLSKKHRKHKSKKQHKHKHKKKKKKKHKNESRSSHYSTSAESSDE